MFRLKPEVDDWFKGIYNKGALKTKWDIYYICLMMGLAGSKTSSAAGAIDLVHHFIEDYKKSSRLIVTLFLSTHLKKLGIELKDRLEAKRILDDYLDSSNSTSLNNEGYRAMNEYAQGGFLLLAENIENRPDDQVTFLLKYYDLLNNIASKNPAWVP
jgi:hypothetical protein